MTLFDKTQQTETETPASYREALVGEGKKFKDDEAMAKGKWEADIYAARLEAELAELRKEVSTRINLEEAIRQIRESGQRAPSNQDNQPDQEQPPKDNAPKQLSQEELDAILEAKLNKRQQEARARENIEEAKREIRKAWGANALSQLEAKASELGMSAQELDAIAARSPKAVLKILGVEGTSQAQQFSPPPRSTQAAPMAGHAGQKNWAYFQKMLRENPTQYHNKATQQEIYKLAMAMGEDFYK